MVNVDGYKFINDAYLETGNLLYKRKNENYEYETNGTACRADGV